MGYDGPERRINLEDKISKMHDTLIRIEPFLKDVENIKRWKDGGDLLPGARAQLWILWMVFLAILSVVFKGV